jgi:2-polyprenyl-3-methyl-5-hydroxy-6-metoxy-1,4-benzoquinol methylase
VSSLLEIIPKKKLHILDLGCGNGSLCGLLVQLGHEVTGIDLSGSGIEIAKKSFPECRFIKADIYDLPYELLENSFDIVLSVEVIEHLLYPRELLRAAKRCLKPKGQFILTTPYHGYLKNFVISVLGRWDKHFSVLWDSGHVKFFSPETLYTLLEKEGFSNIYFKFAGRVPYLWKTMICRCLVIK